ncbi:MAG TPA: site-specific integrase [Roseiflexaceae bacterium]|nr:site-specific integrase [Roseiflexaceae bacterium]
MTDLPALPSPDEAPLAPLADLVAEYAAASRSPATIRAYNQGWNDFQRWCEQRHLPPLPATPATVAAYLADLAQRGLKVATLTRRLAALAQAHQLAGHPSPTRDERVRTVLKGIKRTIGTAQVAKAPATVDVLVLMLEQVPTDTMKGIRDRALLLIGFAGAFRRSELVGLDLGDIQRVPQGLVITVRRSKTDQEGEGMIKAIPYGRNEETCPVRALDAWLAAAKLTNKSEPIFRPVDRHGNVKGTRLDDQSVALIVKHYAEKAGLDPELFAGHSLRAGLPTSAAAAGVEERDIMAQTGHRSTQMVRRYIRDGERFRNNAAGRVGL